MPYNVRELFGTRHSLAQPLLFLAALYASFGIPALAASWLMQQQRLAWWWVVALTLAHTLLSCLLVYSAVSKESMQDLVGAPTLQIWPPLEYIGRFAGLFWAPSVQMLIAATCAWRSEDRSNHKGPLLAHAVIVLSVALAVWYWVVVVSANTDNLTELMAWEASPLATGLLLTYVLLLAYSGSLIASRFDRWRGALVALALVSLLAIPGYGLVYYGTEATIVKYDKVFSAIQFLLSASRDHYVQDARLVIRFLIAHFAAVVLIALTQAPLFHSLRRTA